MITQPLGNNKEFERTGNENIRKNVLKKCDRAIGKENEWKISMRNLARTNTSAGKDYVKVRICKNSIDVKGNTRYSKIYAKCRRNYLSWWIT